MSDATFTTSASAMEVSTGQYSVPHNNEGRHSTYPVIKTVLCMVGFGEETQILYENDGLLCIYSERRH